MNKAELVEKLSKDAEITKAQAEAALKSFSEAVAKTAKKDGKLTLVGFGTFSLAKRKARKVGTQRQERQLRSRPARPSIHCRQESQSVTVIFQEETR